MRKFRSIKLLALRTRLQYEYGDEVGEFIIQQYEQTGRLHVGSLETELRNFNLLPRDSTLC